MSGRLAAVREEARRAFEETGLPTTRLEEWKYTDVKRAVAPFADALLADTLAEPGVVDADWLYAQLLPGDMPRLVFVDGQFAPMLSGFASLPAAVSATAFSALDDAELSLAQGPLVNGFTHLNLACFRDGAVIDVAADVNAPIYLVFVDSGAGAVSHLRNHIHLRAAASVIEHYIGTGNTPGFTNIVTDIELDEDAVCTHYRLQQESAKQLHIGRVHVRQARGSRFDSHAMALGASLSRTDIHVEMQGEGASCTLNGLYLTAGRQHTDHHTRVDHLVPHCTSREYYRGVLDGRSRAVFNGKVVVHEQARKTDAQQSNANLLLSQYAEVDTKPELEIYNDDVKCAHGATIGQMDMEQLFYLRSRGLGEVEARNVLIFAFADDVLMRLPLDTVRRHLEKAALAKLPHGEEIGALV
ncbi:MAG: Fe-S cluster assembly protein SufD [Mariprofundaceae bacterium]|nr:Fe-S cluster assembly protein SufD [Mariprofundaceae bacterium]